MTPAQERAANARQARLDKALRKREEQLRTGLKLCCTCQQPKPLVAFSNDKGSWDGLCYQCRDCSITYQRDGRKNRPDAYRSSDLKKKYGITLQGKLDMLQKQGNLCAACGSPEHHGKYPGITGWHVDHNHATKKVRGLLCKPCNLTLGNCLEDVARLKALVEYLERG